MTQYVPLWMNDNEAGFTADIQGSMAQLKSNVDLQAALDGPPVYAAPFDMASQGVPLIAQPTVGQLQFIPTTNGVFANVSMSIGPGGGKPYFQNFTTLGGLRMTLPNRYYPTQVFEFEDDAVIQSQGQTQQVVAYPPLFTVNQTGAQVSVTMTLFQLYGNATQVVSSGTQEVFSHFLFTQTIASNATGIFGGMSAKFLLGTLYPCAWFNFLQTALAKSTVGASHYTLTAPTACSVSSAGTPQMVSLQFLHITAFTLVLGTFSIVVGVGQE